MYAARLDSTVDDVAASCYMNLLGQPIEVGGKVNRLQIRGDSPGVLRPLGGMGDLRIGKGMKTEYAKTGRQSVAA